MKHAGTKIKLIPRLLIGILLLLFPLLTWAGHARISCTPPPVYDAGRDWVDTSVSIPVALPDTMEVGQTVAINPSQIFQCRIFTSASIQRVDNLNTASPSVRTSLMGISYPSQYVVFRRQYAILTPYPNNYDSLYFYTAQPGVINPGDTLFTVAYGSKVRLAGTSDSSVNVVIPVVAANRSVIVNRNCDFSSQSASVTLPEYSVAGTAATSVPLSLSCTAGSNIYGTMNLTGTTTSSDNTVFTSDGSAQGVGVRFYYNSQPVAANQNLQFGPIYGNNIPTTLGLSVAYARTSGRLTAGTVQSRVNLNFTYY
ncbi:hypothetical protein [Pantoea ananatis]|uniref:hypothetical protein n=1 Tax=Pantoea ananas TaxID=553 RepID=UPI000FEC638C|nr:hypothetical protein [Pantoea ananatis]QAB29122.1 hypothetical protein EPK90_04620 [Pantoea ananatis]